jgi:hypothetical protein
LGHRKNSPNATSIEQRKGNILVTETTTYSMCLICRKRKLKKRQWFPVDEDIEESQVPQQESMDLQVVQHAVMHVADQAMEEVHIVEYAVMEEVHDVEHAVM